MSNVAQRAAAQRQNGQVQQVQVQQGRPDPLSSMMERLKPQMALALPSAMSADRMSRIALTELRLNQKLAQCATNNPASFMGAMLKASALGLEIGNGLGHAYLLPYGGETQLIIGYRGMIDLARRSGEIESLYAVEVYEGESFKVMMGLSQDIHHERDFSGRIQMTPEKVVAVYAVAKLKGGMVQFDVMTRAQIEAIRKRSKSSSNGPWVTDWTEMAKKTVLRRLFKMLPVSIEMKTAKDQMRVSLDAIDNDSTSGGGIIVDADGVIMNTPMSHNEAQEEDNQLLTPFIGFKQQIQRCDSVASIDQILLQAEDMIDSDAELNALRAEATMRRQELGALV